MEMQRTWKKKNKAEGIMLPYFKNYQKATGSRQYDIGVKVDR